MNVTYDFLLSNVRTSCFDITLMEDLAVAIPPSVRRLEVVLRFTPVSPNFHKTVISNVHWDDMAKTLGRDGRLKDLLFTV